MKKELIPFICLYFGIDIKEYDKYILEHPYSLVSLKKVISSFIHLYKANYDSFDFYKKIFKSNIRWIKKERLLLKIICSIHKLY